MSIKTFDVDTQRTVYPVPEVRLLPALEFPMDDKGRMHFRQTFRERFEEYVGKASRATRKAILANATGDRVIGRRTLPVRIGRDAALRVATGLAVLFLPVSVGVPGAALTASNADVVRRARVLVLAVKPDQVDGVLAEIRPVYTPAQLLISIAAGITLARLQTGLGA